jgi:ribosome-associated translation inhibitor RaiA
MPPKNKIITIIEVHPNGIELDMDLKKINQTEIIKLVIDNKIPKIDASLNGIIENPNAILNHKPNNFDVV